jgi:NADH-quinone oxidoreductase E subunit
MNDMSSIEFKKSSQLSFTFNSLNEKKAKQILSKYPKGREISAILPLLDLAQRQNQGWLSQSAIEHVALILNVYPMRVYEVATFYTMFHLSPVGTNVIQICRTASCWLRGSEKLTKICKEDLNVSLNQKSSDGLFTVQEVECLGACVNAPVVQINDDYYETMDEDSLKQILKELSKNPKKIKSSLTTSDVKQKYNIKGLKQNA